MFKKKRSEQTECSIFLYYQNSYDKVYFIEIKSIVKLNTLFYSVFCFLDFDKLFIKNLNDLYVFCYL